MAAGPLPTAGRAQAPPLSHAALRALDSQHTAPTDAARVDLWARDVAAPAAPAAVGSAAPAVASTRPAAAAARRSPGGLAAGAVVVEPPARLDQLDLAFTVVVRGLPAPFDHAGVVVSRRFSHFLWLKRHLGAAFPLPLPFTTLPHKYVVWCSPRGARPRRHVPLPRHGRALTERHY